MKTRNKFFNPYTYKDTTEREYFVQRFPSSGYGIFSAQGRRTPLPYTPSTYDTAEEAQSSLDEMARAGNWRSC